VPTYLVPVRIEMYGLAMVTADSLSEARLHKISGSMIVADSSNSGSFESVRRLQLKTIEVPEELKEEFSNYDNDGGVSGIIDALEESGVDVDNWREKIG
jgi:hypothetical protein